MKKGIAVMYHYVCEPTSWLGSVPISPERFERQLILLQQNYSIISVDNLSKITDKPKCVITFDDATRDQYLNAFPILKKYDIPAYFAVMSSPLEHKVIPTFHLVHAVLSHYTDYELWKEIKSKNLNIDLERAHQYYSYEQSIERRYIKYLLNFVLSEEQSRDYLIEKLKPFYKNSRDFIKKMYIQPEELKEMREAGMTIGVHCVNHLPYTSPAKKFFEKEIEPCIRYMKNTLKITPEWYTPAFGGGIRAQEMREELEPYLKPHFKGVFTTQPGNFKLGDYWLNRIDCNQLEEYLESEDKKYEL